MYYLSFKISFFRTFSNNYFMAPSAPKRITWIIGLVLGILGILGHYTHVQFLSEHNFEFLLAGFILLAAGTTFKDL